jgi:hypothetical protein
MRNVHECYGQTSHHHEFVYLGHGGDVQRDEFPVGEREFDDVTPVVKPIPCGCNSFKYGVAFHDIICPILHGMKLHFWHHLLLKLL